MKVNLPHYQFSLVLQRKSGHTLDEKGIWFCEHNGRLMYRDSHHLSVDGAMRLVDMFTAALSTVNGDGSL
jgi:hypothetical protein